ncbi:Dethiobiotin synthetase [Leptolyngbya sp. FACHB-261]|uniref:Dethiobiotin synthetase n=1 Tax=Leptolyngbya sp. FACHB-261 TaxID=2692806 RepID=UPI001688B8C5|nr:Dethiobiotin synthetase [Leptolyngbya sp. FACHB-261]MBD2101820.1 Dethiobiotin synthetase [Leptolyngbya sp. FACHB-261]
MNFDTARAFLIRQAACAPLNGSGLQDHQMLLSRIRRGLPPLPGQMTSILLALKVVFEGLRGQTHLDRLLVMALHTLATEPSLQLQQRYPAQTWPPLLDDDLAQVTRAVESIFADSWHSGLTTWQTPVQASAQAPASVEVS